MHTPVPLFDSLAHWSREPRKLELPISITEDVRRDYEITHEYLDCYVHNSNTFISYRSEVEKFLNWMWLIRGTTLQHIKIRDVEDYIKFSANPPDNWIMNKLYTKFTDKDRIINTNWRPFLCRPRRNLFLDSFAKKQYKKFDSSTKTQLKVLRTYYTFLQIEGYCPANPFAKLKQRSRFTIDQTVRVVRRLSELQLNTVFAICDELCIKDKSYERTRFIIHALYGMYLRISEVCATDYCVPQMNSFWQDRAGNWWFTTISKGNKRRDIVVRESVLNALKRYRKALGLSELPTASDALPLIKNRFGEPIMNKCSITVIVREVFDLAALRLYEQGLEDEARGLDKATPHWLRHTGISDDVRRGRPIHHIRDDAGHSSSAITDKYIDIEMTERHSSAN